MDMDEQANPKITISIDVWQDLTMAGFQRPDTILAESQVHVSYYTRFRAEAEKIGAHRGYEVEIVYRRPDLMTDTPTKDGDTVERQIWQAAHDAISHADIIRMYAAAGVEP